MTRPVAIKINLKGEIVVKGTANLFYAMRLLCSASLVEEGENKDVRALLEALPGYNELYSSRFAGLRATVMTVYLSPEALPTLKKMLQLALHGGWPRPAVCQRRIEAIGSIPPLRLLAAVSK